MILPYAITRGDDRIWITPEMSENGCEQLSSSRDEESSLVGGETEHKVEQFLQEARASFQMLEGNNEVKIPLIHVLKQINLTVEELKQYGAPLDYDLIMAGHYHGGRWPQHLHFLGRSCLPPELDLHGFYCWMGIRG